jgi:hypothetical protein
VRIGYQVSVDVRAHQANMATREAAGPVTVITEVLAGEIMGWQRHAFQVRFQGPAWTEYGWGAERSHCRGVRFGASVWVFTASPVEYLDESGVWRTAP